MSQVLSVFILTCGRLQAIQQWFVVLFNQLEDGCVSILASALKSTEAKCLGGRQGRYC